jgi:hypothetical protein
VTHTLDVLPCLSRPNEAINGLLLDSEGGGKFGCKNTDLNELSLMPLVALQAAVQRELLHLIRELWLPKVSGVSFFLLLLVFLLPLLYV